MFGVNRINKEQVVVFITAFEYVANEEVGLIEHLKQYLEDDHDILGGPLGWPSAVELYAEKKNIAWFDAFKEITEHLIKVDNERGKE
mgnify:CR=1 FL=1